MPLLFPAVAVCDGPGCQNTVPATVVRDAMSARARLVGMPLDETVVFGASPAEVPIGQAALSSAFDEGRGWRVQPNGNGILCPICATKKLR